MKFASIGDICIDTYQDKKVLGGTSYNSAVVARKYGADVSLISAIGDDENGQLYQKALQAQDVNASHLQIIPSITSTVEITLDEDNSPIFGEWNLGTLASWQLSQNDLEFIKTHDIAKAVCLRPIEKNFEAFCTTAMPKTLKVGDFNGYSQYSSFSPEEIAQYVDGLDIIVKSINTDHKDAIKSFQTLAQEKNKIVLLTLGSKGSMCFANNQTYTHPALELEIINTTGFGDAYIAVFLITYFQNKNIQQSMVLATNAIANIIQR